MMGMGRMAGLGVCVAAALVLGACSSSSKRAADAASVEPTAYSASQPVQQALPSESAALSMAGRWYLNDEFERDCYVNLSAETIDAVRRVARSTGSCSGLMTHVAGWAAYDGENEVRLYDRQGRVIGQLQRGEPRSYKGTFYLTNGEPVSASLRQI